MLESMQGRYALSVQNNILMVEAVGPFNENTFKHYLVDSNSAIEKICDKPWAILTIFSGKGILPPEAESALIDITKERQLKNLAAVSVVIENNWQADLQQIQLARIYQQCRVKSNFFSNKQAAHQWLVNYMNTQTVSA